MKTWIVGGLIAWGSLLLIFGLLTDPKQQPVKDDSKGAEVLPASSLVEEPEEETTEQAYLRKAREFRDQEKWYSLERELDQLVERGPSTRLAEEISKLKGEAKEGQAMDLLTRARESQDPYEARRLLGQIISHFEGTEAVSAAQAEIKQLDRIARAPITPKKESGVVGVWQDNVGAHWRSEITIAMEDGRPVRFLKFGDGSSNRGALVKVRAQRGERARFKDQEYGEIYAINRRGNLDLYDEDGFIREARRVPGR
ncbi:MAG: hypothetical protein AAGN66_05485 [Acidobacteriota bacterium]